jgi:hypothetical protein
MSQNKKDGYTYFGEIYGLSKTEWTGITCYWRQKLKESNFKDIERYTNKISPTTAFYLDNVFRDMPKRTNNDRQQIPSIVEPTISFYRALGLAVHHTDLIPEKYKEAVLLLANGVSYPKIIEQFKDTMTVYAFKAMFSSREFQQKIWNAIRKLDEEALDD